MLLNTWYRIFLTLLLALMLPLAVMAQDLDRAAHQAARQYNAKVLSARTMHNKGEKKVHVIKLLTRDGVVKTVRIPVRDKKSK